MPSWTSILGIWGPKKERVYLPKEDRIYEGPDRAAMEVLKDENLTHLGIPVADDPQIMELAQQRHMTVAKYLKTYMPKKEELAKIQAEQEAKVEDHKPQTPKRGVKPVTGKISGGFGEMP